MNEPSLQKVRGAVSDLLNVIDEAKHGDDLTERGVEWLDALEERIENIAREMDVIERHAREERGEP
jgi:hypothetical protein